MTRPPTFTRRLSPSEHWAWERCGRFQADIREIVGIRAADLGHEDGTEYATAEIVGCDGAPLAVWDVDSAAWEAA